MAEDKRELLSMETEVQLPAYSSPPPPTPTVYLQPAAVEVTRPPSDQLLMSIFTTFCCFWPLGFIAIIKSLEARTAYQNGHHEDAAASIRTAKTFNKLAIAIGLVILLFIILMQMSWIIPVIVEAANGTSNKDDKES